MLFEVYDTDSPAGEVWLLNIQTDAGLAENESMARIKENKSTSRPLKIRKRRNQKKDSHSKNQGGKKNKLTIRYLYHENIS